VCGLRSPLASACAATQSVKQWLRGRANGKCGRILIATSFQSGGVPSCNSVFRMTEFALLKKLYRIELLKECIRSRLCPGFVRVGIWGQLRYDRFRRPAKG